MQGVDVARGLAVLLMIVAHSYDAFTMTAAKATSAYDLTRFAATIPLPAFLLLAGLGVALRVRHGARRGEPAVTLRRRTFVRGLQIVAAGYAVSVAYALIDGRSSVTTLLRADVLHVIGASLALTALVAIRKRRHGDAPSTRTLFLASAVLAATLTIVSMVLEPIRVDGPVRYLLAVFVDVPGVTRMPVVPIGAWLAIGVLIAPYIEARSEETPRDPEHRDEGNAWAILIGSALLVLVLSFLEYLASRSGSIAIARGEPGILLNVLDLGARAIALLAFSLLVTPRMSRWLRAPLVKLGQHSLTAYVVHIPFCYGRFGRPLKGKLDMLEATLAYVALCALTYLIVVFISRVQTVIKRPR